MFLTANRLPLRRNMRWRGNLPFGASRTGRQAASAGQCGDRASGARMTVRLGVKARRDGVGPDRLAEPKALDRMDAGGAQEQVLLGGLDPFGRHLPPQTASHADE